MNEDKVNMSSLPYIVAVDFDGTIVRDRYPEIGEPNKVLIQILKERKHRGEKLILWTCRANDSRGSQLDDAVKYCIQQGLEFDAINENISEVQELFGGDTRKVYANEYIDDKSRVPYVPQEWRY